MSIARKVGIQINVKLGDEIWAVQIPAKKLLVVGIDTYRDSQSRSSQMVDISSNDVNDIQLLDAIDSELPRLNELCMKAHEGYEPTLAIIVVKKNEVINVPRSKQPMF
ncbi:unnamed protein product [Rotaria magnacalcarata]|uniref:Uncharacterized protein n=1 Tax=Rotaria magnacalcarata TaxID=392030 RepID=A0A8S2ZF36_9BILA|nr:unnamed protein product [Rotaria magnacalcarata]CAF4608575.1 unnamed protein product [Rotaria magnacalcarata]